MNPNELNQVEDTKVLNDNISNAANALAAAFSSSLNTTRDQQMAALANARAELEKSDSEQALQLAEAVARFEQGLKDNAGRVGGLEKVVADFRVSTSQFQAQSAQDVANLTVRQRQTEALLDALRDGTPAQIRQLIEDTAAQPEFKAMLANLGVDVNGKRYVATDVLQRLAERPEIKSFAANADGSYNAILTDGREVYFEKTVDQLLEGTQERHVLRSKEIGEISRVYAVTERTFAGGDVKGSYRELSPVAGESFAVDVVSGLPEYHEANGDFNGDGEAPKTK